MAGLHLIGDQSMSHVTLRSSGIRRVSATAKHAAIAFVVIGCFLAGSAAFAAATTKKIIIEWEVSFQQHQANPPELSWGDTLQATYTFTGGRTGTADFVCTAVAAHFLCQGIIRLPEGDIYVLTGPVDEHQPAAIVGGTQAFVGVTGQFTQQEISDNTGLWSLDLRRPEPNDW